MMSISGKMLRRAIKEYVFITFGLLCYAFAWVAIILPAGIVGGGSSGMALLIFYVTGGEAGGGIPLAYSIFAINAVLIVVASFIIGFKFSTKTIYAVIVMALSMGLMQGFVPPHILGLGEDKLLSAILGGAMAGIGMSICFTQGGSTGGTDIIAMIINKYRTVSYGRIIMTCDFIIIGLSYFISHDISVVIYSYVLVAAMGYTLDAIMAGNSQSSQMMIISRHYDQIASQIVSNARRGVTLLDAEGWYNKQSMKVVMVVCRKNEASVILRIIRDIDPDAFITVGSVMSVYGLGFDKLSKKAASKAMDTDIPN